MEFEITEVNKREFKIQLMSSNVKNKNFFDIIDFDRIDICYFAFIRYDQAEDDNVSQESDQDDN